MLPQVDWNSPREMGRNPPFFPVGTQWETCGKNRRQGLGKKGFAQKKVLSLVLCVAMLLSVMVMGTGAASFTDQDEFSDNYAEAAEVLTGMGIIQGYDDGSFLPQRNINRAQVATMIYRAATGDVTDSKISQFVGEDLFDDVNADDWFAGYVNYCGNAEYIKGFTPDTFGPYKQVTGYQVLAMILRAVGYDENNEYTGDQWTLRVAATAREQGLLDNLNPDTNLAEPATRELVAQLIFEAIQIDTVRYSPAAGAYRPSTTPASSLGEQVFDLAVTDDTDMWGRPATVWYAESSTYWNGAVKNDGYQSDKDDLYATIEEEALATYTTAVTECDLVEESGVDGAVDVWTNGNLVKDGDNLNANATRTQLGAQGRLTEVYTDRIVYIDTFLAMVTDVTEARDDANGHLAREALLELTVYNTSTTNTGTGDKVYLTSDSNWEYAEGDMLLVNAVTENSNSLTVKTEDESVTGYSGKYAVADATLEIVQVAESFVGAQTYRQWNNDQHTIGDEVYNDAVNFYLDQAGLAKTENFNWWLDQYGNVIGSTEIDRTGYAVLKDLTWINGGRDGGYAEATLIYFNDGQTTEETVEVNSIDGICAESGWSVDNAIPTLDDNQGIGTGFVNSQPPTAKVSSDGRYNGIYDGYALYQVYTEDDGTVKLEGVVNTDYEVIGYAEDARLDTGSSAILDNGVKIHLSNNTEFLVRTGTDGDYTYTAYTGTQDLPDFAWDSVDVFYDSENLNDTNNIASYVYIQNYTEQADFGRHLFVIEDNYATEVGSGVWQMNVVVGNTERTIETTEAVKNILVNNVGKLYHAFWETGVADPAYGQVTAVALVNEGVDGSHTGGYTGVCDYLDEDAYISGNTIVSDGVSYTVNSATTFITLDGTEVYYDLDTLEDALNDDTTGTIGVWVVDNRFDGNYNVASTVYVGTKLDTSTALTVDSNVDAEVSDATFTSDNTATINVSYERGTTQDTLTYTANDANSVIKVNEEDPVTGTFTTNGANAAFVKDTVYGQYPDNVNPSRTVVVWNEAGTAKVTYTIALNWQAPITWTQPTGISNNTDYLYATIDGEQYIYVAPATTKTLSQVAVDWYQSVNSRSRLYCLTIQDFPAHSQPIYTTLTPKSTTWSPDNKSQVAPVLPV